MSDTPAITPEKPFVPLEVPFDQVACHIELDGFEGPLDLLLHLIHKHELDIFDIPVSFITARYLEYLRVMQTLQLDIAAEYLLMAATLAHIKSQMLLPDGGAAQNEASENAGDNPLELAGDPRAELVKRLLEYQKFKAASLELAAREVAGRDVFPRTAPVENDLLLPAELAAVPLFSLVDAFQKLVSRRKLRHAHEVTNDRVTIAERINELVDRLRALRSCTFDMLFDQDRTIPELVITFMALLEMTKLRMTKIYQSAPLEPIHILFTLQDDDVPDLAGVTE